MFSSLEDGTELCLPMPGSWSDSSDDEAGPAAPAPKASSAASTADADARVAPTEGGHSSFAEALKVIGSIPAHNHQDRNLADPSSEFAKALAALGSLEPREEQAAEVFNAGEIGAEEFAERFAAGRGRPAVIRGVPGAESWPAAERWNGQAEFLKNHGGLRVQVTEMSALHGLGRPLRIELSLEEYASYAKTNTADCPFYVWERNFDGERQRLLRDFQSPRILEDDLYDLTPEVRSFLPLTCHLFVLVGGRRTGSNMHTDPKWSSAWNTLLCGKKRWVMFPRDVPGSEIGALQGDAYKEGGPQAYWWLDHYPRLRKEGARLGMVDILQRPGDTVFIPAGWWHATLNLPDEGEDITVACTRNVFPPVTLPYVLPQMRAADPPFARTFVGLLERLRPDVATHLAAASTNPDGCAIDGSGRTSQGQPNNAENVEGAQTVGNHPSWQLHRRAAADLSLAECRRQFIRRGRPLIIEGLGPYVLSKESCGLSREWLSANFGEKCVAAYRNFSAPELRRRGAAADDAAAAEDGSSPEKERPCEDKAELLRLREVLALLRAGGPEAEGLYLYDLSIPLQLPGLLEHVKLPRYFAHCYLQQTMRSHCFRKSWPTLFIGAAGSQAKLHVDQWHGHFWMHLISGRKRWIIFHPDDAHLLRPKVPEGKHHPVFPDLDDLEAGKVDAPGFGGARRLDVVLEEGETLFVPGGAPHLVVNLTDSLAIAGNFIDESNYEAAMHDIQAMASTEEASGSRPLGGVAAALDEIDFEPDRGLHEECLPLRALVVRYRDFEGGSAAAWGPFPPDDAEWEDEA